jgi:adenylate kinase family enzyme
MEEKITSIKNWLGTGSINIFGLPYSGKDTIGIRLAETLGGKFLSSGLILRHAQTADRALATELDRGALAPSDKFRDIVLPYFSRPDLAPYPLILSSVGRWSGEEPVVMEAAQKGGHPIRATILLNVSEADIKERWEAAKLISDRGDRADDHKIQTLDTRIAEFRTKTMPVIQAYRAQNLLIPVRADMGKDEVFNAVIDALTSFAIQSNA